LFLGTLLLFGSWNFAYPAVIFETRQMVCHFIDREEGLSKLSYRPNGQGRSQDPKQEKDYSPGITLPNFFAPAEAQRVASFFILVATM
jgi:hypothetical protein